MPRISDFPAHHFTHTPNGQKIIISYQIVMSDIADQKSGVRAVGIFVQPNPAQLAEIAGLADKGKVKVCVDAVLPLAEAAKAHVLGETNRTRGKIVLQVI